MRFCVPLLLALAAFNLGYVYSDDSAKTTFYGESDKGLPEKVEPRVYISSRALTKADIKALRAAKVTDMTLVDVAVEDDVRVKELFTADLQTLTVLDPGDTRISRPRVRVTTWLTDLGEEAPNLRSLKVTARSYGSKWDFLNKLEKLEELEVTGYRLNQGDLETLRLSKVRKLRLSRTGLTDSNLERLVKAMPELETLTISDQPFNGRGLAALAGLKKLKALSIVSCALDEENLKHSAKYPALESLTLHTPEAPRQDPVGTVGLEHVRGIAGLKTLGIYVSDANKAAVAKFKKDTPKVKVTEMTY